ncbi:gluconolaconase [Pedobacter sp.]|uniref:beta-propeller domain-containing protein n=1 Tax=Pedobacter sp. TaxID=1411316 RepID=UPI003D7F463D
MKTFKAFTVACLFLMGCMVAGPGARINFSAIDSYPEGLAYDSLRAVYYVSSARTGTIGTVTPDGEYTVLHADSTLKSTYGLKIHPDGNRLFACVGDANYSRYSTADTYLKMCRLISVDLETGKKLSDVDLSGLLPGKHFPNDLVFDEQQNIYLTDSYAHAIYKITPAGQASVFVKDSQFETEGIGVNGLVYHPDGYLLVDNSNTGQLYKVNMKQPQYVQKVAANQFFLGADGLLLNAADTLTIVVNGGNDKIFQLTTDDNWKSSRLCSTTLLLDRFTYPSTATLNSNEVWVMNAKFNELVDSNAVPSKIFAIQRADFLPVPKRKLK